MLGRINWIMCFNCFVFNRAQHNPPTPTSCLPCKRKDLKRVWVRFLAGSKAGLRWWGYFIWEKTICREMGGPVPEWKNWEGQMPRFSAPEVCMVCSQWATTSPRSISITTLHCFYFDKLCEKVQHVVSPSYNSSQHN